MSNSEISVEWLTLFYNRITELYSLSRKSLHDTHHWAITLTLALVTAIMGLGGTADPYPNEFGFIVVVVSFPLLIRFFIRSCLERSIEKRFLVIRNELDKYLSLGASAKEDNRARLTNIINTYYFEFYPSVGFIENMLDNLRLSYCWIFTLWIGLIVWGVFCLSFSVKLFVICTITGLFVIFELIQFYRYKKLNYKNNNA